MTAVNRPIRLVLTDVDGTIVPAGTHEMSERVRQAVVAAENADVPVVPVTGRPYEMAKGIMLTLGFDGLCVLDGGASIRRAATGELVWWKWLEPAVLQELARRIAPHCTLIDYDPGQVERTPEQIDIPRITEAAPYVFSHIYKKHAATLERELAAIPDISVHLLQPAGEGPDLQGLQVTHRDGNKRHGVAELLRLLNVSKEHVMAVGDGANDLPLFENAGLKIAVGNAAPALKAAAGHVVASVDNDGFAEAIERFVLC